MDCVLSHQKYEMMEQKLGNTGYKQSKSETDIFWTKNWLNNFTFSAADTLVLPSASLAERAPIPVDGRTIKNSKYSQHLESYHNLCSQGLKIAQLMQQIIYRKYTTRPMNLLMHQVKKKRGIIRQFLKACFSITKYLVQILDGKFHNRNLLKI